MRKAIEKIPDFLMPYVVDQDPALYTPIDHAAWRYIMRVSRNYFVKNAHTKYMNGLQETGLSLDRIPLVSEMDERLRRFGWRAVAVSGFVPPAIFMEFQAIGILPIACDMRTLDHLAYTPAPDVVHEAAGHAPIISDPEYAEYLFSYGEIARKAIYSKRDMDLYEAIRELSDIKENPASTDADIARAQKRLDDTVSSISYISENTLLSRMYWWTAEYGLVGDLNRPAIYGAGLLSSVGESYKCLSPSVRKLPFSLDCMNVSYDITRPQPQLFVTPDFPTLTRTLLSYAETMAFKKGGMEGLAKAKACEATTTGVLESGIQFSGTLADIHVDRQGNPSYLKYAGPVQLSFQDEELPGHGPDYHREGFSTAVGLVGGKSPCDLSKADLTAHGLKDGQPGKLAYDSGVTVEGVLKSSIEKNGKVVILSFEKCTVRRGDEIFFKPEWGTYDLACGSRVTSVFGGAADRVKYLAATGYTKPKPLKQKTNLTAENLSLNELYARVRKAREAGDPGAIRDLASVHQELEKSHAEDWLLRLELLELARKHGATSDWAETARRRLETIAKASPEKAELIQRGMELL